MSQPTLPYGPAITLQLELFARQAMQVRDGFEKIARSYPEYADKANAIAQWMVSIASGIDMLLQVAHQVNDVIAPEKLAPANLQPVLVQVGLALRLLQDRVNEPISTTKPPCGDLLITLAQKLDAAIDAWMTKTISVATRDTTALEKALGDVQAWLSD